MRAFVLSTGRSGTTTFAAACRHITNYSSAHESRHYWTGDQRLDFPDQHIEVDNRITWHLGVLDRVVGEDALYVHLVRDPEAVARSFEKRWTYRYRGGIIEAFAHAVMMHGADWPDEKRLDVCRWYVQTVNDNIRHFLKDKPNWMLFELDHASNHWQDFWNRIEAGGDFAAAAAEWNVRHAATEP